MSSYSSHGSPRHVYDSTIDNSMPPPPKRRRLSGPQQEERGSGSRYEGPITLRDSSHAIIGDVYETHNHIQPASPPSDQARSKQLVESLAFKRMDARLHNVKTALKNTCQWLFRHHAFHVWMDDVKLSEHRGFMWVKGKPGCGKSTMMKVAYNWAKHKAKRQWITLSYFFNARAPGALEKSSLGLYRSLVHEILGVVPQAVSAFDEMFSRKCLSENIEWTIEELQEFLVRFVEADWRLPAVIFIDALDEGDEADIRALISFLEDLTDHAHADLPLRICLSSRHYPHITIRNGLSLVVEKQTEHDHDIEKFVRDKLFDDADPDIADLHATICAKAAGIFLWVVLVVPILNRLHDQGESSVGMTVYLEKLPRDLEGLFAEILARDPIEVRACVSLLQWVLYSFTPLNSVELYLAIQHSWPRADGDLVTIPTNTALARYILHHSRGLVEVTKSEPPVVQFIHETVREFLAGDRGLAQVDAALAMNLPGWSHARLAQTCFSYFIQNCSESVLFPKSMPSSKREAKIMRETAINKTVPFLTYAVANLLVHAEAAQVQGISQGSLLECLQTADGSLDPSFRHVQNFLQEHAVRRYDPDVTLLYVVAEKGLPAVVSILLTWTSPPINKTCGRYGNALQAACYGGSEDVVRSLLQHHADANATGGEYGNVLGGVLASRNFHLLDLLRTHGLAQNTEVPSKGLRWLRRPDSKDVSDMKKLINKASGLHLNFDHSFGSWLLSIGSLKAMPCNEQVILEMFMDNLSDSHIKGPVVRNDLPRIAVELGSERLLRAALHSGVTLDLSLVAGHALSMASQYGHLKLVQLLLERGINFDPGGVHAYIALEGAVRNGHLQVIKTLLDWDVDVNLQSKVVENALVSASLHGHLEAVQLLLDRGADTIYSHQYHGTALHAASGSNHLQIVHLLLSRGANVNAQDWNGTALHRASLKGHIEVVQTLLDAGASVDLQNEDGTTPLQDASSFGHLEVVRMLLDRGANINATDSELGNALERARHFGKLDVEKLLLERGAE